MSYTTPCYCAARSNNSSISQRGSGCSTCGGSGTLTMSHSRMKSSGRLCRKCGDPTSWDTSGGQLTFHQPCSSCATADSGYNYYEDE